jgi:hypothetical protein
MSRSIYFKLLLLLVLLVLVVVVVVVVVVAAAAAVVVVMGIVYSLRRCQCQMLSKCTCFFLLFTQTF